MIKVIIQIPCYNEEETLGATLAALPTSLPGVDVVEVMIVDDGSEDDTVAVAQSHPAHYIVRLPRNQGLAKAFMVGLEHAVDAGADIIVNTDADNQYHADDIEKLIAPIMAGRAEIVIGARPIASIAHFSPLKKFLQRFGSWVVRVASNTNIPDAPSGFRAINRDAAQQIKVFSDYTYTLETIIQAGQKGMAIISVPVRTNEELRPSRLAKGTRSYVWRSFLTIVRIFIVYRPFRFFAILGGIIFGLGFLVALRFVFFLFAETGGGHVQSLILASLLMSMGFLVLITGILADLISVNRKLLEQVDARLRKIGEDSREHRIGRRTSVPPERRQQS